MRPIKLISFLLVVGFETVFSQEAKINKNSVFPVANGGKVIQDTVNTAATFQRATIVGKSNSKGAIFDGSNFRGKTFSGIANFWEATFKREVDFGGATFEREANFDEALFKREVDFGGATFEREAGFMNATFDSLADFWGVTFRRANYFVGTTFKGKANFEETIFDSVSYFVGATFNSVVNFEGSTFGVANFNFATFERKANFERATFDSVADFSNAFILSAVAIGGDNKKILFDQPNKISEFDFTKVWRFGKDAKIICYGPVYLNIQLEKFGYLSLYDSLDYFNKKEIISVLKNTSFAGEQNERERFELDYLFVQSTKFQRVSTEYEPFKWYEVYFWLWPFIYNFTLGMGYRPGWLVYWFLGTLVCFTIWIYRSMPNCINNYLNRDVKAKEKRRNNSISTFINCLYITASSFLGVRLNKDILTFFKPKERFRLVFIWAFGLCMYLYFIFGSKTGSITYTIKSLF